MDIIEFLIVISFFLLLLWVLIRLSRNGKQSGRGAEARKINRPVSRWEAGRRTAESYSKGSEYPKNYWSIRGGTADTKQFGKVTQHSSGGTSWHNINDKHK